MRQVLSTALVAVIVGAVAGATMGAVAQSPPQEAIAPAAGINADRVDGLNAVGHKATKAKRARKLVATNRQGFLPSNIVKPYWGNVRNKPAGFADGVDDVGPVGYTSYLMPTTYSVGASETIYVTHPPGVDTEIMIIPTAPGGEVRISRESFARVTEGELGHFYDVAKVFPDPVEIKVRVRVFNNGIAPAATSPAALRKAVRGDIKIRIAKDRK